MLVVANGCLGAIQRLWVTIVVQDAMADVTSTVLNVDWGKLVGSLA